MHFINKSYFKKWNNLTNTYDIDRIYCNSDPITVTNQRFYLNSAYKTLKRRVEFYSNEGSIWIIDKTEDIWITIANYDPLVGSSYIPLPPEFKKSMKGLINLKNKDDECFKWCHVRFINPQNKDTNRIKKQDEKIAETLDYSGINFPMKARDYEIVEERFNVNVNVFSYENRVCPLYASKKSNEKELNVLLISNEEKSHYVLIKDFNGLMYSKTKHKDRKHFWMACLQKFTTIKILNNHRERCLSIDGIIYMKLEQLNLKTSIIKYLYYLKFMLIQNVESIDKPLRNNTKLYQEDTPNSIGAKLVCIDDRFTLPTKIFIGNNCVNDFIKWIFIQQKIIIK